MISQFVTLSLIVGLLQGNVLFQDDFDTRVGRWSRPDNAKAQLEYADDKLHLQVISPGVTLITVPDSDLELSHYRLQVELEWVEETPDSVAGVLLNYQDEENFYWLGVSPTGLFTLSTMVDGQLSKEAIMTGQVPVADAFTFDITVAEGEFAIWLNEQELPLAEDRTFKAGLFGLYARAGRGNLDVAFDNLRVSTIP